MDITPVQAAFYAYSSSSGNQSVIVGTMGDITDPSTFNAIDTIPITSTYAYYVVQITTANGYNGTDKFIALAHGNDANFKYVLPVLVTCSLKVLLIVWPWCITSRRKTVLGLSIVKLRIVRACQLYIYRFCFSYRVLDRKICCAVNYTSIKKNIRYFAFTCSFPIRIL